MSEFQPDRVELVLNVAQIGVDEPEPGASPRDTRQGEQHDVVVRIDDEQHRRVAAALADARSLCSPVEHDAKAFRLPVAPLLRPHDKSLRIEPGRVADAEFFVPFAGEESGTPQHGVTLSQLGQALHELDQLGAVLVPIPVDPADLVVLAVGVVVAALRSPELVAGGEHRRALREQQRCEEVLLLPLAQRADIGIVGRSFGAVIPTVIGVMAVAIVLAVRFVVLVVVADDVVQRETVMGGDEVHARPRLAAAPVEDVAGRRQAGAERREKTFVALPEPAHDVAILVVPFRPAGREAADLIAAGSAVPRLGDQLDR